MERSPEHIVGCQARKLLQMDLKYQAYTWAHSTCNIFVVGDLNSIDTQDIKYLYTTDDYTCRGQLHAHIMHRFRFVVYHTSDKRTSARQYQSNFPVITPLSQIPFTNHAVNDGQEVTNVTGGGT